MKKILILIVNISVILFLILLFLFFSGIVHAKPYDIVNDTQYQMHVKFFSGSGCGIPLPQNFDVAPFSTYTMHFREAQEGCDSDYLIYSYNLYFDGTDGSTADAIMIGITKDKIKMLPCWVCLMDKTINIPTYKYSCYTPNHVVPPNGVYRIIYDNTRVVYQEKPATPCENR